MKRCEENQVVRAVSESDILFPSLDSCIAVVAFLGDGDRWATHCVQDHGATGLMDKIKLNASPKGGGIVGALVLGNLDMWGPNLESQNELIDKHKLVGKNSYEILGKMEPYLVMSQNKVANIKRFVGTYFGCQNVVVATCSGDVTEGGGQIRSSRNNVNRL